MTVNGDAKTYVHRTNVRHVRVPLCQWRAWLQTNSPLSVYITFVLTWDEVYSTRTFWHVRTAVCTMQYRNPVHPQHASLGHDSKLNPQQGAGLFDSSGHNASQDSVIWYGPSLDTSTFHLNRGKLPTTTPQSYLQTFTYSLTVTSSF
jgi:hypothetical protein